MIIAYFEVGTVQEINYKQEDQQLFSKNVETFQP